ncbi:MAG: DUF1501 domain-containing protein [Bryobacteraceae bacterium]
MKSDHSHTSLCCSKKSRRIFLADCGLGFTGLVLGALGAANSRANTSEAWAPPDGKPHFQPKAKRVIWLFMLGGVSHVESFDPKPALNKYAGKKISETPHKDVLESPLVKENSISLNGKDRVIYPSLYPMQTGYRKMGESGCEVADWFPHMGGRVDDLSVIRSIWTTDNDHGAILQFHTGRHVLDGYLPTIGSWIHYGLGTLNENLPAFVVLGEPPGDCCGGVGTHGSGYLGPEHSGVYLEVDPDKPLPFVSPGNDIYKEEQRREFEFVNRLNSLAAVEYPSDAALRARIKSYELAFRMQMAVPEAIRFKEESEETKRLYGLDNDVTKTFGEVCLAARRLSERGVRFVQIYHGGAGNAWDAHKDLKKNHAELSAKVDKPIAGLLQDLKQRGLLDETIVVWATEFGRTPGAEAGNGRDHHPFGFSIWMAGGGIKGGVVHGATDELGFHAVENRHYVTDVHATVLHQLGLEPQRLDVPGRKRLEIDHGKPIKEILV